MAVVRLEIEVPDDIAQEVANEIHDQHVRLSALPAGWRSATVRVISDSEARKQRVFLEALSYLEPK